MAAFQVVVSDPETGETYQREVDGGDASRLVEQGIDDEIDGAPVGLDGFTVEITGGSDETGRPMRADVPGSALTELLLEGGVGYEPQREGERRRVTVRGREVSDETAQINVAVVDGEGDVGVALGVREPADVDGEVEDGSGDEAEEADEVDESEEADEVDEADGAEDDDPDEE